MEGRAGPIVGGAQARCGRVNFSVHSPQVSHVSARRAIGRAADLPRCGPYPARRHCQRCYGPLPFRHQGGAHAVPELRFLVAGPGFEPGSMTFS